MVIFVFFLTKFQVVGYWIFCYYNIMHIIWMSWSWSQWDKIGCNRGLWCIINKDDGCINVYGQNHGKWQLSMSTSRGIWHIIRVSELLWLRGRRRTDRGLRLCGNTRSQKGGDDDDGGPLKDLRQPLCHRVWDDRNVNLLWVAMEEKFVSKRCTVPTWIIFQPWGVRFPYISPATTTRLPPWATKQGRAQGSGGKYS